MVYVLVKEHVCVWVCTFQCFNLIHIFISSQKCWCKWEGEERWKLGGESVRSSVRRREESKNICSCNFQCAQEISKASYLKHTTRQWIMNSDGTLVWCYLELEKNLENKEEAPWLPSLLCRLRPDQQHTRFSSLWSRRRFWSLCRQHEKEQPKKLVWKIRCNEVNSEWKDRECELWPHPSPSWDAWAYVDRWLGFTGNQMWRASVRQN